MFGHFAAARFGSQAISKVLKIIGTISAIASTVAAALGNPALAGAFAAPYQTMVALDWAKPQRQEPNMTAVQLFRFEDSAYLVTDGAGFDTEGRVAALGDKIVLTSDGRMALTWSGYAGAEDVQGALALRAPHGSTHDRIEALPDVLAYLKGRAALAQPEAEKRGANGFTLYAATYLDDGPHCYVVTSVRSHGIPTMKLVETDGCMVPAINVPATLPVGGVTAPQLDAIAMLNAQRRVINPDFGGCATVGGQCRMARVSGDGVELRDLIGWPDKIGARIVV